MLLYKKNFTSSLTMVHPFLLLLNFSCCVYSIHDEILPQQKFDTFIQNIAKGTGRCLLELEKNQTDPSKNDVKIFSDLNDELDEFGKFLNEDTKKDSDLSAAQPDINCPELLKEPINAEKYFKQMNRIHQLFFLMAHYSASASTSSSTSDVVYKSSEAFATTVIHRHDPIYINYVAQESASNNSIDLKNPSYSEYCPAKQKALIPLIYASTYVAAIMDLKTTTDKSDEKVGNKNKKITTEIERLQAVIERLPIDFFMKNSAIKKSKFLLEFKVLNPFLAELSDKLMDKPKGISAYLSKYFAYFREEPLMNKKHEENKQGKELNEKSKQLDEHIDGEVRPYSFKAAHAVSEEYRPNLLSVYCTVFNKVTSKLSENYFKDEFDYRLNLFFYHPLHKIKVSALPIDGFGLTRGYLAYQLNKVLIPTIKTIEQKRKENPAYICTTEEKVFLTEGFDYCHMFLYAQVSDLLWQRKTSKFLWERSGYKERFADFDDETIKNLKYMYDFYFKVYPKNTP